MNDHSHRGARPQGLSGSRIDRRVLEIDEALRGAEALSGADISLGFARDSVRAGLPRVSSLDAPLRVSRGMVVHAIPYANWYKVQMGDGGGWVPCCALGAGSLLPTGPREIGMFGPNDDVLVLRIRGLHYGMILGAIPPAVSDGRVSCPDYVSQGSNAGLKRDEGNKFPVKSMYRGGGVSDWSAGRPVDQTGAERGWITSSGLAVTIDEDLVQARVSENAGIWMTLVDGWVRLAGEQLLIESLVHEQDVGDDEGESRLFEGIAMYPHEAVGLYAAQGQPFVRENTDQEVQYTKPESKIEPVEPDTQPFYRQQRYGGYLGQGGLRYVVAPAAESGTRKFGDAEQPDRCLMVESVAADGEVSFLSAKGIHIGKRVRLVAPKRIAPVESAIGDDAAAGGYKFSSLHGSGPDHKVGDPEITATEDVTLLRAAAALDFIAHAINWKALHPFHYHTRDYKCWQESEVTDFDRTREKLDFAPLASGGSVADPEPKKLRIDHRYGEVEYHERESFVRLNSDGSVHIVGGAGEEILMAGGKIRISAPGGIEVAPGTDFVVLADQCVFRSRGSMDFSSSNGDLRFKADVNMQFLSGNSGQGGMMFESRGAGTTQRYEGKFGEDVQSAGLIFKAAGGPVAILGKDIYLRTGGEELEEGDILIDASRGRRRVQMFGRECNLFANKQVTFNLGPVGDTSEVKQTYLFSETNCVLDAKVMVGGQLISFTGKGGKAGVLVDGDIFAAKSIAAGGKMADKEGMLLGKAGDQLASTISSVCSKAASQVSQVRKTLTTVHETTIKDKYYQTDQLGNDQTLSAIQFSFRDPPTGRSQYQVDEFKLAEPHWQQLIRFEAASGGSDWTETPVRCQGTDTYPWPGKKKWVDESTFLRLDRWSMFSGETGSSEDRPGPYESPEIGGFDAVAPDGKYQLAR
jgi:hypothetical protein